MQCAGQHPGNRWRSCPHPGISSLPGLGFESVKGKGGFFQPGKFKGFLKLRTGMVSCWPFFQEKAVSGASV